MVQNGSERFRTIYNKRFIYSSERFRTVPNGSELYIHPELIRTTSNYFELIRTNLCLGRIYSSERFRTVPNYILNMYLSE